MKTVITVPCSSANIGPGFDVIGLALSIYLEVHFSIDTTALSAPSNCTITYEGLGASEVPLIADQNLITQSALYVLRCHGRHTFPLGAQVHIINPIPLGRGLGSSGAAVVAGVILGSVAGGFNNVAAALYGGFVGTYLRELDPVDMARIEIPLSEVLPPFAGGIDTGLRPPEPPVGIGHYIKFKWAPEIKCIAIIPDFEVKTADARGVLPESYPRSHVTYNLQRITLLPVALSQSPPDPGLIYEAMRDKIHQPYRKGLIPGLSEVIESISPETHPGLLGICLSGAGPTILALATKNFDHIADSIIKLLTKHVVGGKPVSCEWKLLQPAEDGATITKVDS